MTLARYRGQRRNSLSGLISALFLALTYHLAAQTISVIDSAHEHPAPGTTLTRFEKIDDGVYKGSEPKNDADYRFLQSKQIAEETACLRLASFRSRDLQMIDVRDQHAQIISK